MNEQKKGISNEQKREWAQILFVREGMTQKEIAAKVGVSERTMTTWVDKYNWDRLRKSLLLTKEDQLRRLYDQLDWLTQSIAESDYKVADTKQADIISKLTASIKSLETETSLAEIVDVGQKFIEFVRSQDLEQAKLITGLFDSFIHNSLK